MSVYSDSLRALVVERALGHCEYCHLPMKGQVATFPLDHILPRTLGGATNEKNLALGCPHCNAYKWKHIDGFDEQSNSVAPIFHPRSDHWADHFEWSRSESAVLIGKTACGRATIARLQINDPDMIAVRKLLMRLGLFPELLSATNP